ILPAAAIAEREPNVAGLKAIVVPETAIVSYTEVLNALAAEIARNGADLRLTTAPQAIRETGDAVEIDTPGGVIRARHLVACAGLQSDRVARMAGLAIDH